MRDIYGVHGAGMANMVFMENSASVLDIVPPSYSMPNTREFKVATELIGVKHKSMNCALDSNMPTKNFEVDVDEIIYIWSVKRNDIQVCLSDLKFLWKRKA